MIETVKTIAIITSASVALCAFLFVAFKTIRNLIKYLKEQKIKKNQSKAEALRIEKIKDELYKAHLKVEKEKNKNA